MMARNMMSMSALSLYRNAVQFGMNLALTFFVPPAQYGLIVFTLPFVALIAMLTDMGLSSAITRSGDLSAEDAGAAFTLTIATGGVLAIAMAATAPVLSYGLVMPGLAPIMAGMAVVVMLSIGATVPRALLERRLRYGLIAGIEAGAVLVAAVLAIAAAARGAGPWSLVLYNLVTHGLRATSFWWLTRRDFAPSRDWRRLGPLLSIGGWVLATNLLNFLARNADNLLIGAWLGSAAVGVYGFAYQFMLAPLMAITWPSSGILLATMRHVAGAAGRFERMIESMIAATATISFPAMTLLAIALAFPMDRLLSPGWHEVPRIVAWLAPLGALQSIASYNGAVLVATGRVRLQFVSTIANTVVLLAVFLLSLPFGLEALVRAYVVASGGLNVAFLGTIVVSTTLSWRRLATVLMPAASATLAGLALAAATIGLAPHDWMHWLLMLTAYLGGVGVTYVAFAARLRPHVGVLIARTA